MLPTIPTTLTDTTIRPRSPHLNGKSLPPIRSGVERAQRTVLEEFWPTIDLAGTDLADRLADQRFQSLYLFAACRSGSDQAFALSLPDANTQTMSLFLEAFAAQREPRTHARRPRPGPGRLARDQAAAAA
jgi:hypothetical protein